MVGSAHRRVCLCAGVIVLAHALRALHHQHVHGAVSCLSSSGVRLFRRLAPTSARGLGLSQSKSRGQSRPQALLLIAYIPPVIRWETSGSIPDERRSFFVYGFEVLT